MLAEFEFSCIVSKLLGCPETILLLTGEPTWQAKQVDKIAFTLGWRLLTSRHEYWTQAYQYTQSLNLIANSVVDRLD